MFCQNCGNEIPNGARFCPKCGNAASLNDSNANIAGKITKYNKKFMGISIIFVVVVLLIVLLIKAKGVSNEKADLMDNAVYGNTSANISCGGTFAEYDSYIFFGDGYYSHGIYMMEKNNNVVRKIAEGEDTMSLKYFINIGSDGFLYYTKNNQIKKIDISNGMYDESKITDTNGAVCELTMVNDWLYYRDTGDKQIYKIRTDGTEKTKIVKADGQMSVRDGWICYINKNELYKVRSNGKEKVKLDADVSSIYLMDSVLFIDDGDLYYTDSKRQSVKRIDLDTNSIEKMFDNEETIMALNKYNNELMAFGDYTPRNSQQKVLYSIDEEMLELIPRINVFSRLGGGTVSVIDDCAYYLVDDIYIDQKEIAYRVHIDSGKGEKLGIQ